MNKKEKQKIIDGIEKLSIVTVEGIAGVLIHKSSVLKLLNAMPEEKADNIFCVECGELVGVGTIMHDINAMPEESETQIAKRKIDEFTDEHDEIWMHEVNGWGILCVMKDWLSGEEE